MNAFEHSQREAPSPLPRGEGEIPTGRRAGTHQRLTLLPNPLFFAILAFTSFRMSVGGSGFFG
jgi:hypothetical protein